MTKTLHPKRFISSFLNLPTFYRQDSFSQYGEDRLILSYFHGENRGFYVDVGAHHPFRFSNTYLLYKKGWHGINIDPTPRSMNAFFKNRPRDTNLEIGIGDKVKKQTFYCFTEPALNTFNKETMREVIKTGQSKLISKNDIKVVPLKKVLQQYAKLKKINLLSIDVEGNDLEVLESYNWQSQNRPELICVEIIDAAHTFTANNNPIFSFLNKMGYTIFGLTVNSALFVYNK